MTDQVRLDRAAVARIIRRASELAGPEPTVGDDDLDGPAMEQALIAAAHEVGLPAIAVQRSLAVERLGEGPVPRFGDGVLGPTVLVVDSEIAGSAHDILIRVDAWLVQGHHLRRDRLRGGRGQWSKHDGVVGATMRSIRGITGEGRLGQQQRITAVGHDIGSGSAAIRVAVDRRRERFRSAASGVVVAVGGTTGLVAAAAASAPVVLLATPVAVVGGIGVAMRGRRRAERTVIEVERLLDSVADHVGPTRLRTAVARRVGGRRRRHERHL